VGPAVKLATERRPGTGTLVERVTVDSGYIVGLGITR
jgi:hypothetical protein